MTTDQKLKNILTDTLKVAAAGLLLSIPSAIGGAYLGKRISYNEELEALKNQREVMLEQPSVEKYASLTRYSTLREVMLNVNEQERAALLTDPRFKEFEDLDKKIQDLSAMPNFAKLGCSTLGFLVGAALGASLSYVVLRRKYQNT